MNDIFCKDKEKPIITYTHIIDTIPNRRSEPLTNWKDTYQQEWRWRILQINDKKMAEISYIDKNNTRFYFIPGKDHYETRNVPKEYDQYVTETYYDYS